MSPGIYDNVFMKKSINIANRLDEVNGIVAACNGSTMSFEQAYELARFYYDFQDTNALIADAEVMAGEDLSGLREIAISLKAETTTEEYLIISNANFLLRVASEQIAYVCSEGSYCNLRLTNGDEYTFSFNLVAFEKKIVDRKSVV